MGSLIGGVIGGVGSLFGGHSAKSNSLTGFNYLTGKNGVGGVVNNGVAANNAEGQLLGTQPVQQGTKNAFSNYLNSSGYNFIRNQGTSALTGSAAARGILNSGATGKALESYGQNLANGNFTNYLNSLNGLTSQGLTASGQIGQAGTLGGVKAGDAMQGGITSAAGQLSGAVANNWPTITNFFGGL